MIPTNVLNKNILPFIDFLDFHHYQGMLLFNNCSRMQSTQILKNKRMKRLRLKNNQQYYYHEPNARKTFEKNTPQMGIKSNYLFIY